MGFNLKETVDAYLIKHYKDIEEIRGNSDFRWSNIAYSIDRDLEGEYVRNRYSKLRKKDNFATSFENKKHNVPSFKEVKDIYLVSGNENKDKGTKEFTFTASNIPTEEEIITHFNIDTTKYKISQIWHKTTPGGKYSISVNLQALKGVEQVNLSEDFLNKLSNIKAIPTIPLIYKGEFKGEEKSKPKACLIIPKQDAHWNMYDVQGNNSIEQRFETFTKALFSQLEKAQATNKLEKIIYIVGSDEFNSEYTQATTKGTPQQNILTYEESFEKITEFNIETIKLLGYYAEKVEVVLLNGNHDHYVGWHLANVLKHVFSKSQRIDINSSTENTKIVDFHKCLLLLNHGDASTPKALAAKFPVIAHDVWSNYETYLVISGDKHHERSSDINGVICYQVPQLSSSMSAWSDKKTFIVSKPELLTFLLEETELVNILRKTIK